MKKNNKNRLISLKLNNFASFREEEFIEFDGQDPIYMVVGHNASGKTNLLRSLAFLEWLLIHTFEVDKDKELPCDKFLFSKKTLDKPTKIEVEYISSGNHYLYSTRLDKKKILFEELDQRLVVNKNHSWVKKFSREWNEERKSYKVDCKSFGLSKEFVETVKNVSGSFLAVTRKLNTHEPTNQATELWHRLFTNVLYYGKNHSSIEEAVKHYRAAPQLLKEAVDYLKTFDLGLENIDLRKIESPTGENKSDPDYIPIFIHKNSEGTWELNPFFESEGTRSLFTLLDKVSIVLKTGGMGVFDEIDNDLHPLMMEKIIKLFRSKETNPLNASLIFASHNANFLNQLQKENIIFVEKDKELTSHLWKLSDIGGIRRLDNYSAKYLAGAYGAIIKEDGET